ncbi:MAG: Spy/CpxP family protein refolding chaperone [Pseudomonadota bacterium]|nr:Spy/CpxP family protein refolding chaperone [Pseudomonadota bacterium]
MNPVSTCRSILPCLTVLSMLLCIPVRAAEPVAGSSAATDAPDGMGHLHAHGHGEGSNDADAADGGESCAMMDGGDGMHQHGMMMGGGGGMHRHGMMTECPTGHCRQAHQDDSLAAVSAPAAPAWLRGIELDDTQQDRIFEILHEVAPAQRRAQRSAEATHRRLQHAGMASDYSEADTRKLSDQHARAVDELTMLRVRTEKRILDVLTPDQKRDAAHQAAHQD